MGINENSEDSMLANRNKNSIVELDKKCFSCCGFPASTLSAFKMACLAYNPSSISIDSKEYKREELLGFTTGLLQKIKQNFINFEELENMGSSQIELKKEEEDKMLFGNDEIKHKFNDIENETAGKKSSGTKFRKSKKFGGYSTNKYQTRSTAKHSSGMKD